MPGSHCYQRGAAELFPSETLSSETCGRVAEVVEPAAREEGRSNGRMGDNRVKVEQIIGECILKAAHVILGARSVQPARAPSRPTQKSWVRLFGFALPEATPTHAFVVIGDPPPPLHTWTACWETQVALVQSFSRNKRFRSMETATTRDIRFARPAVQFGHRRGGCRCEGAGALAEKHHTASGARGAVPV